MEFQSHSETLKKYGYVLGHKLGSGAHSTCFTVKKIHDDRIYVCKISNLFGEDERSEKIKLFHNEIAIMSRLKNPNIIELFDFFEENGFIYLVIEYCEKGSMQKMICHSPEIVKDNIKTYANQICDGLFFLHENGVAHVDLKPDNILINADNQIKLADFGLSDFNPEEEKRKEIKGTKIYMAPEVLKGETYDPFMADIWSLAVTLFQMVSGGYISQVDNMMAMWNTIYAESHDYGDIGTIIRMCMAPNPENRPKIQQIKQKLESKEKPSEMKALLALAKKGRSRTNSLTTKQARTFVVPKIKKRIIMAI